MCSHHSRRELSKLIETLKTRNPEAKIELFLCRSAPDYEINKALNDRVITRVFNGEAAIKQRIDSYLDKIDQGNKSPNRVIIVENIAVLKNNEALLLSMKFLLDKIRKGRISVFSVNDIPEPIREEEVCQVLEFRRSVH